MSEQFDSAKIKLPDGRVAYDAVALAKIETEGIHLTDFVYDGVTKWKRNIPDNCDVIIRTRNTDYHLRIRGNVITIKDERRDGRPNRFPEFTNCNIHGSTWGGSMLKMNYIGVNMHLEFSTANPGFYTTSQIESLTIRPAVV